MLQHKLAEVYHLTIDKFEGFEFDVEESWTA